MAINIDCVDWQSTGDAYVSVIQRRLPAALKVNSVGQMVNLIEQRLGSNRRMRRLRIFGHGISGVQGLGNSGSLFQTNLYNQITIGSNSEVLYADILGRLRTRFLSGGWAELHGCNVGASAVGWNLLKGLARLWQVNVAAGTSLQTTAAGFEVAYRVAQPNGQVRWRRGNN